MNGQNIQIANEFPDTSYEMEWSDKDIPKEYENYDPNEPPLPDEPTQDEPSFIKYEDFMGNIQKTMENLCEQMSELKEEQDKTNRRIRNIQENYTPSEQNKIILDRLEDNAEATGIDEKSEALSLLPVFNTIAQKHIDKIKRLEKKRAEKADRLDKSISKYDELMDRISRLDDTNQMLEKVMQYLPNSAPQFVSSLCDKIREPYSIKQTEKKRKLIKSFKLNQRQKVISEMRTIKIVEMNILKNR